MDRETERDLLNQCHRQLVEQSIQLAKTESEMEFGRYYDQTRFIQELEIFRSQPIPYLHSSQLEKKDSFRALSTLLGELLVARDHQGTVRAFYNSCRHRGMQLLGSQGSCRKRVSCPYHGWTYNSKGEVAHIPDGNRCFPNLNKEDLKLVEVPTTELFGFIWICPEAESAEGAESQVRSSLGILVEDFLWMGLSELTVHKQTSKMLML